MRISTSSALPMSAVGSSASARVRCYGVCVDGGAGRVGGGGCPGKLGIFASMHAHGGAAAVQMVAAGGTSSGVSRVPARMKTRCGRDSASLNRWVPQMPQKRRCIIAPLSATLV